MSEFPQKRSHISLFSSKNKSYRNKGGNDSGDFLEHETIAKTKIQRCGDLEERDTDKVDIKSLKCISCKKNRLWYM